MAEFLTTKGIASELEKIIREAKKELYLVSPYLKLSNTFHQRLVEAANRGVRITIIYGKDELKDTEKKNLSVLKNLELCYSQNLHAKCYFNETRMVITSMNMYDFSEINNYEMGILITPSVDAKLYADARQEAITIHTFATKEQVKKSTPAVSSKPYKSLGKPSALAEEPGYCIRCKEAIDYDPLKPYCYDCYQKWAAYENQDYKEKYCHSCGSSAKTSMGKPECYDCYK